MAKIVTVTLNPAIDMTTSVHQVVPGRKLRCHKPRYDPGGGGINVARVIRRLGGDPLALWTCGQSTGQTLGKLLDEEDISHQPIPIQDRTRENYSVYESSSEQQFRFVVPGPELRPEEIDQCKKMLCGMDPSPDYLVLSGSLAAGTGDDVYAQLAQEVPSRCRVIVDTNGEPLKQALNATLFLIKPNLRELNELSENELENDGDIEGFARKLTKEYPVEAVLTSLGGGGAILVTPDAIELFRAPTVSVRSRVGAGDSALGAIVWALANGRSLSDSVRFGMAAGSAAVMTEGNELCRREDTERLYKQHLKE